ncbi:MAG: type III PLP-dependent enzyme, partial [Pseudomonadota bacterium]
VLPGNVVAGDYIEIGMLGAYGTAMRTKFNGFGTLDEYEVSDEPMASAYVGDNLDLADRENVISFPAG